MKNDNNQIEGREKIAKYLKREYNIDSNNMFQILQQEVLSEVLSENSSKNLMNIERSINYHLVYIDIYYFIV